MKNIDREYILIAEKKGQEVEADENHFEKKLKKAGFVLNGGFIIGGDISTMDISLKEDCSNIQGESVIYINRGAHHICVNERADKLRTFIERYTPVPLTN